MDEDESNWVERQQLKQTVRRTVRRGSAVVRSSEEEDEDGKPALPLEIQTDPALAYVDQLKAKVKAALVKPSYDVKNYYHKKGLWQKIAKSSRFENITLGVISVNAIWLSIDTELNNASFLLDAKPVFQVAEQFFCFYFSFEWLVRFMSFKKKHNCLRDRWFVFDSCLVLSMFAETWVMSTILVFFVKGTSSSSPLGNVTILRLFRLLRLSRMARMLRSMPELMILIKGMVAAMRSVFFVLVLLVILMYIFAITFTQLLSGSDVGTLYFDGIFPSMLTLTCSGTFFDNFTDLVDALGEVGWVYLMLFLLFVLLAALTVLNMLIGVLCEVVSAVAATEKEDMLVNFVKGRMKAVIRNIDKDSNGLISRKEFEQILGDPKAVLALVEVGVDPEILIDNIDYIYEVINSDDEDDCPAEEVVLDFGAFMEVIMQFRGSNIATLKDIVDLRKHMDSEFRGMIKKMKAKKERAPIFLPAKFSGPKDYHIAPEPLKTIANYTRVLIDNSNEPFDGLKEGHLRLNNLLGYRDPLYDCSVDSLLKKCSQHACLIEAFYSSAHLELYRVQKVLPTSTLVQVIDAHSIKCIPWKTSGHRIKDFFVLAQAEGDRLRALFYHTGDMKSLQLETMIDGLKLWLSRAELIAFELGHFVRALRKAAAADLAWSWDEAVALQELLGLELSKLKELREGFNVKKDRRGEITVEEMTL